jgi:hypothetical protein
VITTISRKSISETRMHDKKGNGKIDAVFNEAPRYENI